MFNNPFKVADVSRENSRDLQSQNDSQKSETISQLLNLSTDKVPEIHESELRASQFKQSQPVNDEISPGLERELSQKSSKDDLKPKNIVKL